MPYEIEKKYLVKKLPKDLNEYSKVEIAQGYVDYMSKDYNFRLRNKGNKYFKTYKKGSGLVREEIENEISKEEFEKFWPDTQDRRVEKTRYLIPYSEFTVELDIFQGKLKGLIMAEVEFKSEKEAHSFIPPDWFGDDVTDNPGYTNHSMAINGLPRD